MAQRGQIVSRPMTATSDGSGRLAENVMHFARVLRGAGIPVGPDRVIDALRALEVAGIERRDDFYWTLAAVFLDRREQFELFDQAFHIFWRDPHMLERVMALMLPKVYGRGQAEEPPQPPSRLAEALLPRARAAARPMHSSRSRDGRGLHGLRPRGPAARRLRDHDQRRAGAGEEA